MAREAFTKVQQVKKYQRRDEGFSLIIKWMERVVHNSWK